MSRGTAAFDTRPSRARAHLSIGGAAVAALGVLVGVIACGGTDSQQQAPAAVAAAQAAAVQCVKDAECKGDRVCNNGRCVFPH